QASTAKWKIVLSEVAWQQFWALPYDRWEGYGAERNEILNFIRDENIEGVVFLTTDNHANIFNEVFIDVLTDPEPIAYEA
ncbi:alkaline phosphatase D family protein, partial [Acinetobacter baumannii]